MKSKSKTKDSEAKQTMPRDRPMLINEPLVGERRLMPLPKKLMIKLTMYRIKIPPIPAAIISLKFSVGLINPLL